MTNLTSEQYRDVLKRVVGVTEIPTVQHLLRRAVETFFRRYGAYPELAGVAPGKIGIFGEQTQFDGGLALPVATPMATIIVGRKVPGPRFSVATSADVGKPHKVKFSFSRKRPLGPGCPAWLNRVKGVIDNYPGTVPPFEAAVESSVPMGVGFGSSSAVEVATYSFLEVLVGKKADPVEKAKACQAAERDFAGNEVGLVDRIASVLAKDRHAMLVDCKTNEVQWIPFRKPKIAFVAVDSHEKDTLFGEEYPERSKYAEKACEILGIESLRNCTEEDLQVLETRAAEMLEAEAAAAAEEEEEEEEEDEDEEEEGQTAREGEEPRKRPPVVWTREEYDVMVKRARFFVTEMARISAAVDAWNEGDVETFGEKMKESHRSLKEDFELSNPLLDFLVDTSLQVEGVLGSRMAGMGLGFGGGIITLVNKENVEKYCRYVTEKFAEHEAELSQELQETRQQQKDKRHEIKKRIHSEHFDPAIASSERIGQIQAYLETGGILMEIARRLSSREEPPCPERKKTPCIVKVEKKPGGCGTWARHEKERDKQEFLRKKSLEEETAGRREERDADGEPADELRGEDREEEASAVSEVRLREPSFYVVSPFAGARMMFITKTDILRSLYASFLPQAKTLVRSALETFKDRYGNKPEAVGVAPATAVVFGEFMEYHLGYLICMALPMYTVTVGGRNDGVFFSFKTTSKEVEEPQEMKRPLPCVRPLEMESRSWVNYATGTVNEFKGHVPGFNAVVDSSVPIRVGLNSCAALQASIYTFLESLTRDCTLDPFEKAYRCAKSEYEFLPAPTELVSRCSSIRFFPTFLCKEGHLMFINCKRYKISHYFFDHPSYAFIVACCKRNTSSVTIESLEERLKQCSEAIDVLGRTSLLTADLKHLRCLRKRDASEQVIKRVKYVITEHQRTIEAIKAVKDEDYARVGVLMNQSHASLRDDYEVSSPEIEELVSLANGVDGVLGAKMLGKGLNASVIILVRMSDADKCIRYVRKNYKEKTDKPVFYMTKPSEGAFMMDPALEVPVIP